MYRKISLASMIFFATLPIAYGQTGTIATQAPPSGTTAATPTPPQTAGAQQEGIKNPSPPPKTLQPPAAPAEPTKPAIASPYVGVGLSLVNVRGYTGLTPKLYVGYDTVLGRNNQFFWGVEAFAGAGSWKLSTNSRHRITGLWGGSIMPGFVWDEWTKVFVRLGAEAMHFSQLNSTKAGGLIGIGFQTYEFGHWYLRAEYDYNFVRNVNQYNLDFLYKFC